MSGRFAILAEATTLRLGEDAHLTVVHQGELIVQDFDLRMPLRIEIRDREHDWFAVRLRVRWCRHERESVLIDLMELAMVPDHHEYPIPADVLSEALWWKAIIDATTDHLFRTVKDFDPGCPEREALFALGWTSGPVVLPTSAAYPPIDDDERPRGPLAR